MAKRKTPKQKRKMENLRRDSRRVRKLAHVEAKLVPQDTSGKRRKPVSDSELKAKLAAPLVLPEVAQRNAHPEKRPSKAEVIQRGTYAVFIDFNSHTCLRVGAGTEYTYFIPMDSAGLDVHQLRHSQFDDRFKPYGYPLIRAAKLYAESAQSFGYTEKARQHLEEILSGSTSPKEQQMATKKAMKKGKAKKHVVFDPKRMIVKGNKDGLKKARAARMAGSANQYADKKIKHLTTLEKSGLRKGTGRYDRLAAVLKVKNTNDVLGKKVSGVDLGFMVERKFISLS